ncbi:MAG: hypothetical protein AAGB32_05715, partial [Pseudomonadota bacterium]
MSDITHEDNCDSKMDCGVFTSKEGNILIVHDKPLQSDVEWVQYDPEHQKIYIVCDDGELLDTGIDLNQDTLSHLSNGQKVFLSLVQDKKIVS